MMRAYLPGETVQIRKAEHSDIRRIAELWVHTFPGERTLAERVHVLESGGVYGGIETVHIAQEGADVVGAMKLQAMTQYIGGGAFPMMGVAAVAVAPWARRRGAGRALCEFALRHGRERGDVLSVLYPFRPDFYTRFGWTYVGELHSYLFRPEWLVTTGTGRVRLATPRDESLIAGCYARIAARSNGLIERTPRIWQQHLDAVGTHAFLLDGTGPCGYMLVNYGQSRSPERRRLFIREIVADGEAAYDALLSWIPLQRDQWRRVRYDATSDERFDLRLNDQRRVGHRGTRWLWAPSARVLRGPMLRVLNVRVALERRRRWHVCSPFTFRLAIHDPQLPENCGPFDVEYDGESVHTSTPARAQPVLNTDIATFSQLYAGEIDLRTATRMGRATVNGNSASLANFFQPDGVFRLLDEF
jgi:predicted acetyltransferase